MAGDLSTTNYFSIPHAFASSPDEPFVFIIGESMPGCINGPLAWHHWQYIQQTAFDSQRQNLGNDGCVLAFGRLRQPLWPVLVQMNQIIPNYPCSDLADIIFAEVADQTIFGSVQQFVVTTRPFRLTPLHGHQFLRIVLKACGFLLGMVTVDLAAVRVGKLISHFNGFQT